MKDKRENTREEKQVRGFLNTGFEYKGIHYRPMTIRTLLLLERAKSPFYLGGDQLKGLIDFLYVSSKDSNEILSAIESLNFDIVVMDFAEQFTMDDLAELGKIVEVNNADVTSTIVEVIESGNNKKK